MSIRAELRVILVIAIAASFAAGVQAQTSREVATADARAVAECVAAAESRAALDACRGRVSKECLATDYGATTAGSINCYTREQGAWGAALNAGVEALLATDTDAAELLRAAQAAWLPWRAAKCAHEASIYSGGSLERVVSTACVADETAARAIALIARQRGEDFLFATETGGGQPSSESPPPAGDPPWVDALIAQFQSAPVANPPRAIWRHRYETETLYYVPSDCCDQYDELRAASGAVLCAPGGGLTGRGDGRCPALGEPLERTIVWQDPRPAR